MRLSQHLPEAIHGPAAVLYSLVQRSRFAAGRIEPFGMYRRVEVLKEANP